MRTDHHDGQTVVSIKDPRVVAARKGLEDRSFYLIEGGNMLRQAMESGASPETVFFLEELDDDALDLYESTRRVIPSCYRVARGVFFKILGLGYETATELLALVRVPRHDAEDLSVPAGRGACYLVGQGIQDPRNVGVLVRTADAFSATAFVLSADSAFPWSRQSIRSSTGSIFRVPVYLATDLDGFVQRLKTAGVFTVGSSSSATEDCRTAGYRTPCALLLGNETSGISDSLRRACDLSVRIPMSGGTHSLNVTVAAGILLHELGRHREA